MCSVLTPIAVPVHGNFDGVLKLILKYVEGISKKNSKPAFYRLTKSAHVSISINILFQ